MKLKHYIIGMSINCVWIGLMELSIVIVKDEVFKAMYQLNIMMAIFIIMLLSIAYFKGE